MLQNPVCDPTTLDSLARRTLVLFISEEKSRENLNRLSEFLKSERKNEELLSNPMKRRLEVLLEEQLQIAYGQRSGAFPPFSMKKRLKTTTEALDESSFLSSFCPLLRSPQQKPEDGKRPLFSHKLCPIGSAAGGKNGLKSALEEFTEEDPARASSDESEDVFITTAKKSEKNKAKNVYKILGYRIVTDICTEKVHWQYQTHWKLMLNDVLGREGVPAESFKKWVDENWLTFNYANGEMEKRCNLRCKKDFILMLEMSEKLRKEVNRKSDSVEIETLRGKILFCEAFRKVALLWLQQVAENFLMEKTNRLSPGTGTLYLQKIPDIIQLFRKYDSNS
jgi:hypothetical protein